jgi:hypothetical protein
VSGGGGSSHGADFVVLPAPFMVGMTSVQSSWVGHRGSKLSLTVMLGELLSISFLFFSFLMSYYITSCDVDIGNIIFGYER